jgi:ribosome-binding factor A
MSARARARREDGFSSRFINGRPGLGPRTWFDSTAVQWHAKKLSWQMSRRTEMLGSTIQRELAEMIMRDLQDPRLTGLPSITRVKVSTDLSIADVYITVMGTEGQQVAALNALKHSAGMMRAKLTRALTLRQAPFLKFHIDENLKKEIAVLDLIRKANEEQAEREREREGSSETGGPAE